MQSVGDAGDKLRQDTEPGKGEEGLETTVKDLDTADWTWKKKMREIGQSKAAMNGSYVGVATSSREKDNETKVHFQRSQHVLRYSRGIGVDKGTQGHAAASSNESLGACFEAPSYCPAIQTLADDGTYANTKMGVVCEPCSNGEASCIAQQSCPKNRMVGKTTGTGVRIHGN